MTSSNNTYDLALEFRQALNDQEYGIRMMTSGNTKSPEERRDILDKANERLVAAIRAICAE